MITLLIITILGLALVLTCLNTYRSATIDKTNDTHITLFMALFGLYVVAISAIVLILHLVLIYKILPI